MLFLKIFKMCKNDFSVQLEMIFGKILGGLGSKGIYGIKRLPKNKDVTHRKTMQLRGW